MTKSPDRIRAIDMFSGVGGSSLGAAGAGVDIVAAIDYWQLASDTYQANFPDVRLLNKRCEDVRLTELKRDIGTVNLLIASPECTSHTCAKGSAPRSEASRRTAFEVVRFAATLKPRWIVVENVVHMRSWNSYSRWIRELEALGYKIRQQVINSADHGVPQSRRRLFVMCDRERVPPEVMASVASRATIASVLDRDGRYTFSPLRSPTRAIATIERADRAIAELGKDKEFLIVYYGSDASGGWQRLDVPLRTLTTLDRFAYVRVATSGHEMRMLQVPEIKAAMGFPDAYKMDMGNRRDKIKLLGNAVCPPVLTAVVRSVTTSEESE